MEGAITNRQSGDTGKIKHLRYMTKTKTKTNKYHKATLKTEKMSNTHGPHTQKKPDVNPGARKW